MKKPVTNVDTITKVKEFRHHMIDSTSFIMIYI